MRKALSAAILAVLWLAPASARAEQPEPTPEQIEQAKGHFQSARDHLAAGQYDQAVAEYQAAYQLYPDAEFLFNIGEAYRLSGDKVRSVEYFQRYLELEPNGRGAADARTSIAALEEEIAAEQPVAETPPLADGAEQPVEQPVVDQVPLPPPPSYPVARVDRPLQLLAGQVEVGFTTRALTATYFNWDDDEWQYGFARWITADLAARYAISDRIEVGVELPLVAYRPDKDEFSESPRYGVLGRVGYLVNPLVSVHVRGGLAGRQRIIRTQYQIPTFEMESRGGFGVGATVHKSFGKLLVSAGPELVAQLASWYEDDSECPGDDPDCWSTSFGLHLPVAVYYQVTPAIAAGLVTGIYSGHQMSFNTEKSASLPALAVCQLTTAGGKLDLGLEAGFANLIDYDDYDSCCPTDGRTFFVGLSAAFRNR